MRAVVQRVTFSKVTVEGEIVGEIGKGLTVLLGVGCDDTEKDVEYLADKIVNLRILKMKTENESVAKGCRRGAFGCIPVYSLRRLQKGKDRVLTERQGLIRQKNSMRNLLSCAAAMM